MGWLFGALVNKSRHPAKPENLKLSDTFKKSFQDKMCTRLWTSSKTMTHKSTHYTLVWLFIFVLAFHHSLSLISFVCVCMCVCWGGGVLSLLLSLYFHPFSSLFSPWLLHPSVLTHFFSLAYHFILSSFLIHYSLSHHPHTPVHPRSRESNTFWNCYKLSNVTFCTFISSTPYD